MADDTMFSYTLEIKDGEMSGLITARGNSKKEFIDNLATLDEIIQKRGLTAKPPRYQSQQSYRSPTQSTIQGQEESLGNCKKCGAPNKRSMKGKVYCSAKCWLNKEKQY